MTDQSTETEPFTDEQIEEICEIASAANIAQWQEFDAGPWQDFSVKAHCAELAGIHAAATHVAAPLQERIAELESENQQLRLGVIKSYEAANDNNARIANQREDVIRELQAQLAAAQAKSEQRDALLTEIADYLEPGFAGQINAITTTSLLHNKVLDYLGL